MTLETVSRLIDDFNLVGISPQAFGAYVTYCAHRSEDPPTGTVNAETVATGLGVSTERVELVLDRFVQMGTVTVGEKPHQYELDLSNWQTGINHVQWVSQTATDDELQRLQEESSSTVEMITSAPPGIDEIPYPNITGRMVDMVASASESVTVVNPFFTQTGLDLLVDAFVGATSRGVPLQMITRDIERGDQSNREDMKNLVRSIQRDGQLDRFELYEIDTDAYPDASLHAKAMVADQQRAYVGSANLTEQSLRRALEIGLYLEGSLAMEVAMYLDQCKSSDLLVDVDIDSWRI